MVLRTSWVRHWLCLPSGAGCLQWDVYSCNSGLYACSAMRGGPGATGVHPEEGKHHLSLRDRGLDGHRTGFSQQFPDPPEPLGWDQ